MTIFKYVFICIAVAKMVSATGELATKKPAKEDYILPKSCTPLEYKIHLAMPSATFTNESDTFYGEAKIKFYVNKTTKYIFLHVHNDSIEIQTILISGYTMKLNFNNKTDILKITLSSKVYARRIYELTIYYIGTMSVTSLRGLYKKSYIDLYGNKRYYLSTMFSTTYARRVFPCFDEPSWKAIFEFNFTVPWRYGILFNTPREGNNILLPGISAKHIMFKKTPKMSTYLLGFLISDSITCTSAPEFSYIASTRVCSRDTTKDKRAVAVEFGRRLLDTMGELMRYSYEKVLMKMEHVAIPHMIIGAMENWGLIAYSEDCLLWGGGSNKDLHRVITTIAHEVSHQWFGNLVTMKWWSEAFLNEGFGAYFEYFLTHEVLPEWQLDKQFVVEKMQSAFTADSFASSSTLQSACYRPDEIEAKFGVITYDKGACIVRMIEHFMQRHNFFEGLRHYIETHQFQSVTSKDLWRALNRSVVPSVSKLPAAFSTVMENWIKETGFPLIAVSIHNGIVTIRQLLYPLSSYKRSMRWYVPISYTLSTDSGKFLDTTPRLWLTPTKPDAHITLPKNCKWIIFNNQRTAYYKVMYDPTSLANIAAALKKENFDGIDELERAKIVDDLFSLAKIALVRYSTVFEVIQFLRNDTSYFSWNAALSGFESFLLNVGYHTAPALKAKAIMTELIRPLVKSVPIHKPNEDDQLYTLKQVMAHKWACRLGFQECKDLVTYLLKQYRDTGDKPHPNLRKIVYCHGIEESYNKRDWKFLWEAYFKEGQEFERNDLLYGLTCTNDDSIIKKLLYMTIEDKYYMSYSDAKEIYLSLCLGHEKKAQMVLNFFRKYYFLVEDRYGEIGVAVILSTLSSRLFTPLQIQTYHELLNVLPKNLTIAVYHGMDEIISSVWSLDMVRHDILQEISTVESMTISSLIWLTVFMIFRLYM